MTNPPRSPKGHRPQVFDDPAVDQLHAAYVALATELAVAFERIATLEAMLERTTGTTRQQLEQLAIEQQKDPARAAQRRELAERLLQPFQAFREARIAAGVPADQVSGT